MISLNSSRRAALLRGSSALGALSIFAAAPGIASAQAQGPSAPAAVGESTETGGIEDIVVSARRREETAQSTPIAITAISGEGLIERSVRDVSDLQSIVPGLSMNQNVADPFSVNWQLRAQSATDTNSVNEAPVAVYSDGVFLNSLTGVLSASTVDIQRVEVLKGPQGTLYGRNSTGGAVNFYTNPPVDAWEGNITIGAGSYRAYNLNGVVNAPLGGGNAIRLVAEVSGDSGYGRNLLRGVRTGGRDVRMIRGAIRLVPADNVEVTVRADYSKLDNDGGAVGVPLFIVPGSLAITQLTRQFGFTAAQASTYYNGLIAQSAGKYEASYNADNYATLEVYGTSATIDVDLGGLDLKSITAYRHAYNERSTDTDATPADIFYLNYLRTKIKQFTQEVQLSGDTYDDRLHFTMGGYYLNFRGKDDNASTIVPLVSPTQPTRTDGKITTESLAGFAQVIFDIMPTLHFTGGLRYTHESKTLVSRNNTSAGFTCNVPPPAGVGGAPCVGTFKVSESNVSYTAGLDWNVSPNILLYAKTSRGFKSGGVNEKLTANPGSIAPYEAEKVTDYELGVKADLLDRRLRVNATYFHSKYTNAQRSVFTVVPPFNAISVVQNAASATIDGVEVEMLFRPVEALRLEATLGYTDPKYKSFRDPVTGADFSSQPFNQVSKWTYSLSGSYRVPTSFGSATLRMDWSHRSERNLFPSGGTPAISTQPGYGLLNGQLRVEVEEPQIDVRLFVKNILDKYYIQSVFDVTPVPGIIAGYPGAPRTWGVSVTKTF